MLTRWSNWRFSSRWCTICRWNWFLYLLCDNWNIPVDSAWHPVFICWFQVWFHHWELYSCSQLDYESHPSSIPTTPESKPFSNAYQIPAFAHLKSFGFWPTPCQPCWLWHFTGHPDWLSTRLESALFPALWKQWTASYLSQKSFCLASSSPSGLYLLSPRFTLETFGNLLSNSLFLTFESSIFSAGSLTVCSCILWNHSSSNDWNQQPVAPAFWSLDFTFDSAIVASDWPMMKHVPHDHSLDSADSIAGLRCSADERLIAWWFQAQDWWTFCRTYDLHLILYRV